MSAPRSQAGADRPRSAVRSPQALAVFLAVVAVGLAADLLTKHVAFQRLLGAPPTRQHLLATAPLARQADAPSRALLRQVPSRRLLPGVRITLSTNPGVVFGLPMPRWAVALATAAVVILVGVWFAAAPAGHWPLHVALALILGGALGNLYDRMFSVVALPVEGFAPIQRQVRGIE